MKRRHEKNTVPYPVAMYDERLTADKRQHAPPRLGPLWTRRTPTIPTHPTDPGNRQNLVRQERVSSMAWGISAFTCSNLRERRPSGLIPSNFIQKAIHPTSFRTRSLPGGAGVCGSTESAVQGCQLITRGNVLEAHHIGQARLVQQIGQADGGRAGLRTASLGTGRRKG